MMLVDEGKLTLDDPVEKICRVQGQMVVEKRAAACAEAPEHGARIMSHTSA